MALARQGREEGYRELLRRWHRPVYALIYRMVGERAAAKELTQETFVRIFHAALEQAIGRLLKAWREMR